MPVVPSSMIGRTDGMLPGADDGFFDGLFDDDDDDATTTSAGPTSVRATARTAVSSESAAGGPDASSVSLVGWMPASATGDDEIATGVGTTPMAGIVTAKASVPAGDVANALGRQRDDVLRVARAHA